MRSVLIEALSVVVGVPDRDSLVNLAVSAVTPDSGVSFSPYTVSGTRIMLTKLPLLIVLLLNRRCG
jgi:hypothetical protein